MKNALTLLIIILFVNFTQAQNLNYEDLWDKVEQFEKPCFLKANSLWF